MLVIQYCRIEEEYFALFVDPSLLYTKTAILISENVHVTSTMNAKDDIRRLPEHIGESYLMTSHKAGHDHSMVDSVDFLTNFPAQDSANIVEQEEHAA